MTLSPLARRITYVVVFEIFAIAFATMLLATLSGGEAQGSLPVAVASSVAAVVWNFIYNTLFERWERIPQNSDPFPWLACSACRWFRVRPDCHTDPAIHVLVPGGTARCTCDASGTIDIFPGLHLRIHVDI